MMGPSAGQAAGAPRFYASRTSADEIQIHFKGESMKIKDPRAGRKVPASGKSMGGEVRAPMAGKVMEVKVKEGDQVEEGELAFVVESMKMQLEVMSPVKGKVKEIKVVQGEILNGPDILAVIEELN